MPHSIILTVCLISLAFTTTAFAGNAPASKLTVISPTAQTEQNPLVVIYTLSTCPHCKEAKEFLTTNKIPFINREIDTDEEHLSTLIKIYDSMGVPEHKRGVPLLVIGNKIKLQGFNKEKLLNALKEVTPSPK
ncbi:glutaredoxin family protein [Geobacter pelophilus]|jgi:glutaredoxin|uniref:Glutaredoxin family protein n=1 Tax=Geoanaerobacter pelophilus TaxID=60036 RepID=A0AAW4LBZ7_9BACT|nr:glutaredoxin family protein [Geoanaerobacter pelophilus]MBT0664706.1 glutaredoxin family protein [Geoanaerobacter pelophilus]